MMIDEGLVVIGGERAILYSMGKIQTVYLHSVDDEIRQGRIFSKYSPLIYGHNLLML